MTKRDTSFTRSGLIITGCFICFVLLGAGTWASVHIRAINPKHSQEIEPRAVNRTDSLHVINITKSEGPYPDVEVTLLNRSSKNILAYTLTVGKLSITTDYAAIGKSLAPGQTAVEKIPFGNFEVWAAKNPSHAGELVVAGVYFDDRTGEGEPRYLRKIEDSHSGAKKQIGLILPLLRSALSSSLSNSEIALQRLEMQAAQLPTESGNVNLPANYRAGREEIQQNLMTEVKRLRNKKATDFQCQFSLNELIASYEQILAKL